MPSSSIFFISATATVSDPNRKHLEAARTLIAKKSGNTKGAFEALRRSVSLAPDWGPGLLELALLLARQNQFKEAVETAEKVAALEPKNLQVLAGVIDIAHRAGHTEMAIRHLRRGLELVPGDQSLRRLLAKDLSEQGKHDESMAEWDALVQEFPSDPQSLVGRVQACIAAGKPGDARENTTA